MWEFSMKSITKAIIEPSKQYSSYKCNPHLMLFCVVLSFANTQHSKLKLEKNPVKEACITTGRFGNLSCKDRILCAWLSANWFQKTGTGCKQLLSDVIKAFHHASLSSPPRSTIEEAPHINLKYNTSFRLNQHHHCHSAGDSVFSWWYCF